MNPQLLLATRERDCRTCEPHERGVRRWTHVELPSSLWFAVECCVERSDGERTVRTFISADLSNALHIYRQADYAWAYVRGYMREPLLFPRGHLFETLAEAFSLGRSGAHLLRFASGLMVVTAGGALKVPKSLDLGERVFP